MTNTLAAGLVMMALSGTWFLGCDSGSDAPSDASIGPRDGGPRPDAWVPDGGGTAPPLAPCESTAVCASAPGVECRTSVPGGACTRRCDQDSECGAAGSCVSNLCLAGCSPGGGECLAHAGACLGFGGQPGWCMPICYPAGREPPGYPSCGAGLFCDPYTAACTDTASTGLPNGAPCRDANECRGGECLLATDTGGATGFLDGMCASLGVATAFSPGGPLPQGSCPDGSVEMVLGASEGDAVLCMMSCARDGDCRSGYACAHSVAGLPFTNGLCLPIDCSVAACPSGTVCGSSITSWLGYPVCERTP